MRAACTLGTSPCSAIATRQASSICACGLLGRAPVVSSQKCSVRVTEPIRSLQRSRPRMTIMSAFEVLMLLMALNCFPIFTLALHSRGSRAPTVACRKRVAQAARYLPLTHDPSRKPVPTFPAYTLMAEMPRAGEHHGDPVIFRRLDHFVVTDRAAGLDHRRGAGLDRNQQSVREREERIGGHDGALCQWRGQA